MALGFEAVTPPRNPRLPHLTFEWVPEANLLLACHVNGTVSDAVWDAYVAAVQTNLGPKMRCLVWNEAGRPTVAQQRRLLDVTRGTRVPVAILSSSVAVRFIVSVFALANQHVRFFPASDISRALFYLCHEQSERAAVRAALGRVCEQAQMPALARER